MMRKTVRFFLSFCLVYFSACSQNNEFRRMGSSSDTKINGQGFGGAIRILSAVQNILSGIEGAQIELTGENFVSTMTVTINSQPCDDVIVKSPTSASCHLSIALEGTLSVIAASLTGGTSTFISENKSTPAVVAPPVTIQSGATQPAFISRCPANPSPTDSVCVCQKIWDKSLGTATTGTYNFDIDEGGPIPARTVYCDMEHDSGGWTLVSRVTATADPLQIDSSIPDYAEFTSNNDTGSQSEKKYVLSNLLQGYKTWTAKVNGTWMNSVSYATNQAFNNYTGMFHSSTWPSNREFILATNALGGAVRYYATPNCGTFNPSMPMRVDVAYSVQNYGSSGTVLPFLTPVPAGADNNYCMIGRNFGTGCPYGQRSGFNCRTAFSGSTDSANTETIEIFGR